MLTGFYTHSLCVTYVFTHLLGLCIKQTVLSLKTAEVTDVLPIFLLSQTCSSSLLFHLKGKIK